jgi:hypothetical protein
LNGIAYISAEPVIYHQVKVPRFIVSAPEMFSEVSIGYIGGAPELMNLDPGPSVFPFRNALSMAVSN